MLNFKIKSLPHRFQKLNRPFTPTAKMKITANNNLLDTQLTNQEITDEFSQFLYSLLSQTQAQEGRQDMVEKLQQVYRQVLRFTMKRNLEKAD